MGAATVLQTGNKAKRDKAIIRTKHVICSKLWELDLSKVDFWRFCPEGTSEIVLFLECLQQSFVLSSLIFWVFKLSRVNCVYESPKFSPQILSKILQRYF